MRYRFIILPFLFLTALLMANAFNATAADESYVKSMSGAIGKNDSCTVVDDKFINLSSAEWNQINNISVDNIVRFELRHDSSFFYYNRRFTCTLYLKIKYFSSRDQEEPHVLDNIKLVVAYDTARGSFYKSVDQYSFQNAFKVTVLVDSIASPEWGSELPPVFRIHNQIQVKRKYPFQKDVNAEIQSEMPEGMQSGEMQALRVSPTYQSGMNQMRISWEALDFPGYEEFDIEWTFVDQMSENGSLIETNPSAISESTIDGWMRFDNSRVTITGFEYSINLPFTEGFLLARVRSAAYDAITGVRQTSNWQYLRDDQDELEFPAIAFHEENLNWQYNASYAEEGKRKEVMAYFDGAMRGRQTVTVNNEDQIAIAAETIYDNMGRPALNILPSPVLDQATAGTSLPRFAGKLQFYPNVNQNSNGDPYSFEDFLNAANCVTPAPALNTADGAALYYSPQNPYATADVANSNYYFTKYLPNAEGFAFTQTAYLADNTGRIRSQGGVGKAFRLGSGHETSYFYGKPLQSELYRLFGMEAGNASHYLKNMVVDANGQVSVSYVDAKGRTIATALGGQAPASLDELPSGDEGVARKTITQRLMAPGDFQSNTQTLEKEATATFLASVSGNYTLQYSISPAALGPWNAENAQTFCSNCYYEIEVSIKDDCGELIASSSSQPFQINETTCAPNAEPVAQNVQFTVSRLGGYTVAYKLRMSEDVIRDQTDYYIANNIDLFTIQHFFNSELLMAELESCFTECTTCEEKLGTRSNFIAKVNEILEKLKAEKYAAFPNFDINDPVIQTWIDETYTSLQAKCAAAQSECALASPCETNLQLMKSDVRPGGQYFLFDPVTFSIPSGQADISIISTKNGITGNSYKDDPAITNFEFTDEDGVLRHIKDPEVTLEMFIKAYELHPEWADDFVTRHVEYCSYLWCTQNSSSFAFDNKLREEINTGAQAQTGGFYNDADPNAIVDLDPFFNSGGAGVSYKTKMLADMNNLSAVLRATVPDVNGNPMAVKNIVQLLQWQLYCIPLNSSPTAQQLQDSWVCNNFDPNCRSLSMEWELFRAYYLKLKSKYLRLAKLADNPSCENCYVGNDLFAALSCNPPGPLNNYSLQATTEGIRVIYNTGNGQFLSSYRIKVRNTVSNVVSTLIVNKGQSHSGPIPGLASVLEGEILEVACLNSENPSYCGSGSEGYTPCGININSFTLQHRNCSINSSGQEHWETCSVYLVYNNGLAPQDFTIEISEEEATYVPGGNPNEEEVNYYNVLFPSGQSEIFLGYSHQNTTPPAQPASYLVYRDYYPTSVSCVDPNFTCPLPGDFSWDISGNGCQGLSDGNSVRIFYNGGSTDLPFPAYKQITVYFDVTLSNNVTTSYSLVLNSASGQAAMCAGGLGISVSNVTITAVNCVDIAIPGTPASTCADDPRAALYAGKVRRYNDYVDEGAALDCILGNLPLVTSQNDLDLLIAQQVAEHRLRAIEDLAEQKLFWLNRLWSVVTEENAKDDAEGVPRRFAALNDAAPGVPSNHLITLVNELELVARKYIEIAPAENIRPASTLPSPHVSSGGYASFAAVFAGVLNPLDINLRSNGFNQFLLEQPFPHDKTPIVSNPSVLLLDPDICTRVSAMKTRWTQAGSPGTFHSYLQNELGDDYKLTASELADLEYRCNIGCRMLNETLILPAVFAPAVPGDANFNRWATCTDVDYYYNDFRDKYPNVEPGTKLFRTLLANSLNHQFGFTLSYDEYMDFMNEGCVANANAALYNKPATPAILTDYELVCLENTLRTVYDRAGQEYARYIEEERRKFRNNYISTCLKSQASAKLTGDLYEYHYTLYYYDQSGNLVKTVPPEGVALLSDEEITRIEEYVENGGDGVPNCSPVDQPVILDATTALTAVSDALNSNSLRAIEFWFGGDAEGDYRQTRWVTPDQKYLWQTAVRDGHVWAELFELQPDGNGGISIVASSGAVAALEQNAALDNWTHVLVQSTGSMLTSGLQLFVNGELLTNLSGPEAPAYPFEWSIGSSGGNPVLPENRLSDLKHLRLYNRVATGAEVLADYQNACLSPVGDLATLSSNNGPLLNWARFNIPPPGSPNTIASQSPGSLEVLSSSGQLLIENNISTVSNTFTMEFWAKPSESIALFTPGFAGAALLAGQVGQKYAIYPGNPSLLNIAGAGVSVGTNGVQVVESADGYMPVTLSWSGTINNWTHIAVVYNNRQPSLYINGSLAATGLTSQMGTVWPSNNLRGGQYGAMKGKTDDIRIWNTARSGSQIAENRSILLDPATPGLVANWPLDPVAGSFAPDIVGSNNAFLGSTGWLWSTDGAPVYDPVVIEYQSPFVVPDHQLPTHYAYNSLNQVIRQESPDGGVSQFWYDRLGRLVASQNAEQKDPVANDAAERYSYTLYDAQGRIVETGERYDFTPSSIPNGALTEDIARTPADLAIWLDNNINRQVTQTAYDVQPNWAPTSLAGQQRNLRKRVAATRLLEDGNNLSAASYYNYDIIGNVSDLYQQNADQQATEALFLTGTQGIKHIRYEYDLVSGKVNRVRYQAGKWDQFGHSYAYDAENRLTDYYSTRHNFSTGPLVSEAHYRYYMHGPLARTELGDQRVQGMDYAYTLQGWLKGVNSQVLDAAKDMSGDGLAGSLFANVSRDVFAFSLGYYGRPGLGLQDYIPIGAGNAPAFGLQYDAPNETIAGDATGKSLFNGNISHATYAWSELNNGQTVAYSYRYDQLNRLKAMRQHALGSNPGTWSNSSVMAAYAENISYDANGNILSYERHGADQGNMPLAMDQLSYQYERDAAGRLRHNQLQQVRDAVADNLYSQSLNGTADIDDQPAHNYQYDRIGNLIADESEDITAIRWTVYGKIASINKKDGTVISYGYDVSGNRIRKSVTQGESAVLTYYVRDAQGNVMAVYTRNGESYTWEEQHLYGSSRVGLLRPGLTLNQSSPLGNDAYSSNIETVADGVEGKRVYELSNHLGNVLATISDRKIGVDVGGDTQIDYYIAEVLSQQDYYPFGMLMPGRGYSATGAYRYGFNGKENDNEVKGEGGQQDYGMRIYDPRLGRFLSVDPIGKEFPELTPYQFASNSPIEGIDLDGLEYTSSKRPKVSAFINYNPELKLITKVKTYLIYQNFTGYSRSKLLPEFGPKGVHWTTYESDLLIDFAQVNFEPKVSESIKDVLIPTLNEEEQLAEHESGISNKFVYTKDVLINASKKHQDKVTRNFANVGIKINEVNFTRGDKLGAAVTVIGLVAVGIAAFISIDEFTEAENQSNFLVSEMANKLQDWLPKIPEEYRNDRSLTQIADYLLNGEEPLMTTPTGSLETNKDLLKIGKDIWNDIVKDREKDVLKNEMNKRNQLINNRVPADNTNINRN